MATKIYTANELKLALLFERLSSGHSNAPLEEQWYWKHIQELLVLTKGGLHPSVWVSELLKRL